MRPLGHLGAGQVHEVDLPVRGAGDAGRVLADVAPHAHAQHRVRARRVRVHSVRTYCAVTHA